MEENAKIKEMVKEKYGTIANQTKKENESSCCGTGGCCTVDHAVFAEDYKQLKGYNKDADLGLGCGIPTEFAKIKEGDIVIDLGSGAGNDCFVARELVGSKGAVIGIDMTDTMIEKAKDNAAKLGFDNVEFIKGDIEELPLPSRVADVIISNCVLNLVPDKFKAFKEAYRVLKLGGTMTILDVVVEGILPDQLKNDAEMYAGCVAGAMQKEDYLRTIFEAGFDNLMLIQKKNIELPDEILSKYFSADELKSVKEKGIGLYSITVSAEKPEDNAGCCGCGCGC